MKPSRHDLRSVVKNKKQDFGLFCRTEDRMGWKREKAIKLSGKAVAAEKTGRVIGLIPVVTAGELEKNK